MILKIPTELSDKQVEEYQRVFKEKYGVEISKENATEEGLSLIRLVAFVIDDSGKNL